MNRPFLLALIFLAAWATWASAETVTRERYALVIGSNSGGRGTATLKYASSDAKHFQEVLTSLGGLKDENTLLLVNPGKESLAQGLAYFRSKIARMAQAHVQTELVFYYSGHSDDQGLLLGSDRVDWSALKAQLAASAADVRIVVLDSCSSGAFTRSKGGQISAPFLLDLSSEVTGHAFLTSSTETEVSQESDRIGSSFFTHALIEGLRGAADADDDGQVTLNEAYDYAYQQTSASTRATTGGTQHPAFDIQLNGQGSLVMTDLRSGGATLVFSKDMAGTLAIRDIANNLVAEVSKDAHRELTLGVKEGYYRISWERAGTLSEASALVDGPQKFPVQPEDFQGVTKAETRSRGATGQDLRFQPVGLAVIRPDDTTQWTLNLFGGEAKRLEGGQEALAYNRIVEDGVGFQLAGAANTAGTGFQGVQLALGVNLVGGDTLGLQAAGIYNGAQGRFSGLQVAGVNWIGGTMTWGQVGVFNLVEGEARYVQLGAWNQAQGGFTGVQAGLLFNSAKTMTGVQVGLVNYSEEQTGVQVGLVNISHSLHGLPIGLIDIQFNGQNHIDQTLAFTGGSWDRLDQDLWTQTTVRFGSEYFYKYFQFGTRAGYTGSNEPLPALSLGAGLGLRVPLPVPGVAFHLDGGTNYIGFDSGLDLRSPAQQWKNFLPQVRTFASWTVWKNVGILAGWDHPIYTAHVQSAFSPEGKLEVKTDWGNLYVANRFFLGLQI